MEMEEHAVPREEEPGVVDVDGFGRVSGPGLHKCTATVSAVDVGLLDQRAWVSNRQRSHELVRLFQLPSIARIRTLHCRSHSQRRGRRRGRELHRRSRGDGRAAAHGRIRVAGLRARGEIGSLNGRAMREPGKIQKPHQNHHHHNGIARRPLHHLSTPPPQQQRLLLLHHDHSTSRPRTPRCTELLQ